MRDRRQEVPPAVARFDLWLFERNRGRRASLAKRQAARPPSGRRGSRHFGLWLWSVFLDVTTGHGTRSHRLGVYLLVAVGLMWLLFLNPESVRRAVTPTAVETALVPALAERDTHPPAAEKEWGASEAGFVALRTVIPLMGDLPNGEWEPSGREVEVRGRSLGVTYETLAGVVHALSYVVLPLFLASVTGWLKKRGE